MDFYKKGFAFVERVSDQIVTRIERITYGADGIGRSPSGKLIFIPRTLPGELVRIKIDEVHKRFIRGTQINILESSEHRIEAECSYYEQCGGCQLRHTDYDTGCSLKFDAVCSEITKLSGLPLKVSVKTVHSPLSEGYRVRARFRVDQSGSPGFMRYRSGSVVKLESCPNLKDPLQTVLQKLQNSLPLVGDYTLLLECDDHNKIHAVFETTKAQQVRLQEALSEFSPNQRGLSTVTLKNEFGVLIPFYPTDQAVMIPVKAGKTPILLYPGEFRQANNEINGALIRWIIEQIQNSPFKRIWDLYCGYGNLSFPLAEQGYEVYGIDFATPSISAANRARKGVPWGSKCVFLVGDLQNVVVRKTKKHKKAKRFKRSRKSAWRELWERDIPKEILLLDPARQGVGVSLPYLLASEPAMVIYVSCHPPALARDLKVLDRFGYTLEKLALFDMFPQTSHVEAVALLKGNQ